MTLALTSLGLQVETFDEIRDSINAKLTKRFGPIDLSDNSIEGQLVAIIAERLASGDSLLRRVFTSWDPDAASGSALDAICSLNGTLRGPATKSATVITVAGVDGTLFPGLSTIRDPNAIDGSEWESDGDVTIATIPSWAGATLYALDDRVTNGGNAYVCITGGVSAPTGGPTSDTLPGADDITDGTAHWRYIIAGTALADVVANPKTTGPVAAAARALSELMNPLIGITGVVNLFDAAIGSNVMTDADLRRLRLIALANPGTGPLAAIRAAIKRDVSGVTSVNVFENVTEEIDADGMPAHTVEALVTGGDDQDIFDALRVNVVGGIKTHGTTSGTSTDVTGGSQVMKLSRVEQIVTYVTISVTKNRAEFPNDGADQIKSAIVAWGQAQLDGRDIVPFVIGAQATPIIGVTNITSVLVSVAPVTVPVSGAVIVLTQRQRALYDSSRISVILTDGEP